MLFYPILFNSYLLDIELDIHMETKMSSHSATDFYAKMYSYYLPNLPCVQYIAF